MRVSAVAGRVAAAVCIVILSSCGGGGGGGSNPPAAAPAPPPPAPAPLSLGPETCSAGSAGDFACSGISLRKRVPLDTMGGSQGNDIWGWRDPLSGEEYALMGLTNGTAFVNVTNPDNPVFVGRLPTQTVASNWRDI